MAISQKLVVRSFPGLPGSGFASSLATVLMGFKRAHSRAATTANVDLGSADQTRSAQRRIISSTSVQEPCSAVCSYRARP